MEKINIAELLKDCPKGMELYSPIFGKVYLDKIRPHLAIVVTTTNKEQDDFKEEFLYDGRYGMNGECMLFPSKSKTTWEGFVPPCKFKDGDIVISDKGDIHLLRTKDSSYCAYRKSWGEFPTFDSTPTTCVKVVRLATEEEKQELFDAIKFNGYEWKDATKTLNKLVIKPKFKVGHIIHDVDYYRVRITEINEEEELYIYCSVIAKEIGAIPFEEQDNWKLVPNKFDINTLKPFESRVLVRHNKDNKWCGSFFSFIDRDHHSYCYKFVTTAGKSYPMMIPYKGNEWLLGKTDDCDEYYKTW